MGRTLRRVPLDFSWPMNKTWEGYLNPNYHECPETKTGLCQSGYSAAGKWLDSVCRLMAMLAEQALEAPMAEELRARGCIYPHPYLEEWSQAPRTDLPREKIKKIRDMPTKTYEEKAAKNREMERVWRADPPKLLPLTPELQTFLEALAGEKATRMMGSNFGYSLAKRLQGFAGVDPETWGRCRICGGSGQDPAFQTAYDAWTETKPPEGPGYQLWETTSEGSPVSPVFATIEELCAWCEPNASVFGTDTRATKEQWREMLDADFVRVEEVAADGTTLVFM